MVDNTAEPCVTLTNTGVNVHPRTMAAHLLGLIEPLIEHMEYFKRHEQAYGVNFDEQRQQAEDLIIEEANFLYAPDVEKFEALDNKWSAWADRLFERLQDAALDLDFSDEKRRLDSFVDARTAERARYFM